MKLKPFLFGLTAGCLAGCIGTLLTALDSGNKTRKRIRENNQHLSKQLQELKFHLEQLKDSVIYATIEGKMQISAFLSDIQNSLTQWEEDILPHQQDIRKELAAMKANIQKLEEEVFEK